MPEDSYDGGEGQPTSSVKDQIVKIWSSGGHTVSATTTQLRRGLMKTVTVNIYPRGPQVRAIFPQGTYFEPVTSKGVCD